MDTTREIQDNVRLTGATFPEVVIAWKTMIASKFWPVRYLGGMARGNHYLAAIILGIDELPDAEKLRLVRRGMQRLEAIAASPAADGEAAPEPTPKKPPGRGKGG